MAALSARDLLLVWEQAERRPSAERALVLLAAACPGQPAEALADLPLGRREARLFALYEEMFGSELELATPCPRCGEMLEIDIDLGALASGGDEAESAPIEIEADGLRLVCRPLSSADLAAAAGCADAAAARRLLATRAVLAAARDGREVDPAGLSIAEMDVLSRALSALDARAEVLLDFTCPGCGNRWQALLDGGECLWREIDAAARRLLREVHALARAYHWREADILAMSARRRRRYLEILAG